MYDTRNKKHLVHISDDSFVINFGMNIIFNACYWKESFKFLSIVYIKHFPKNAMTEEIPSKQLALNVLGVIGSGSRLCSFTLGQVLVLKLLTRWPQ